MNQQDAQRILDHLLQQAVEVARRYNIPLTITYVGEDGTESVFEAHEQEQEGTGQVE